MENVRICLYHSDYKDDFIRLNTEWITTYFKLEESDIYTLSHVQEYILDKGGQVFFALKENSVIGCCALIAHPESGTYELAKMAVSPSAQGLGVGKLLGESLIGYAKEHEVKQIFLEGNTNLAPSIGLYRSLGFKENPKYKPAYERCNIMMTLDL